MERTAYSQQRSAQEKCARAPHLRFVESVPFQERRFVVVAKHVVLRDQHVVADVYEQLRFLRGFGIRRGSSEQFVNGTSGAVPVF